MKEREGEFAPLLELLAQLLAGPVADLVVQKLRRDAAAPPREAEHLVTVAEFARARSISVSTVRAAIRAGRLPATKIGRSVRVRADAQIGKPARGAAVAPRSPDERAVHLVSMRGGR